MAAMSDYLEDEILDHILRNAAFTSPSAVYLGLSTGTFGDDNSGTELTGNNYSRVAVTFDPASGGATDNTGAIEFAAATGTWGSVGFFGLFDASSAGNLLIHGALASAKTIQSGDILKINAGDLDITID
jgi:hypothetical protein|tara:strand:+ start:464 stop:850 length:387 start_codon:yes stop_codon:yes gene_type:complete